MRQLLQIAWRLIWFITFCQMSSVSARPSEESEPKASQEDPGERLYQDNCAKCHDNKSSGAPSSSIFSTITPRSIYEAISTGPMRAQAAHLSDPERRRLAEYLAGAKLDSNPGRQLMMCSGNAYWFDDRAAAVGVGWGIDSENTRLIPSTEAGFFRASLPHLKLRWAFAFPGVSRAVAQPLVVGHALFVGSQDGTIYALDTQSGCVHWTFRASAEVVGAILPYSEQVDRGSGAGRIGALIFGDRFAYVYGLDPRTGAQQWKVKVEDHPSAMVVGTPALWKDQIYVPVSSQEESEADPKQNCCTFRGSVVALAAATGATLWKRYTIPKPPAEQFKNTLGVPQFGPSGAGVWVTPAIDRVRGLLYVATGNNYSDPGDENSDAIFAMELATGKIRWRTQTLQDTYNNWSMWCPHDPKQKADPDCPSMKNIGPDIDINGSPILIRGKNHHDILVVGRKDGTLYGVNPDNGRIRWTERNSSNPNVNAGALWYGMMAEDYRVFVPSIGTEFPHVLGYISAPDDGLYAFDAFSGKRLWAAKVSQDCGVERPCFGIASTPIGFPGVVFAGAVDGYLRAYDSRSGKVIWRFDTAREFKTTNGDAGKGGGIARNGIMIANGALYVSSGFHQNPGNVLLAFTVDDKGKRPGN